MENKFNLNVDAKLSESLERITNPNAHLFFNTVGVKINEFEISLTENNMVKQIIYQTDRDIWSNNIFTTILLLWEKDNKTCVQGITISSLSQFAEKKIIKIQEAVTKQLAGKKIEFAENNFSIKDVTSNVKNIIKDSIEHSIISAEPAATDDEETTTETTKRPHTSQKQDSYLEKASSIIDKKKRERELKKKGL